MEDACWLLMPSSAIVNWLEAFDGGGKAAH